MFPPAISDIIITGELAQRGSGDPDYLREKLAFRDLAHDMANTPGEVLPRLVRLAMEASEAVSAGISILDRDAGAFRWFAVHGSLAMFEGTRAPLDFSPCGVTLASNGPMLMRHPETVYDWIREAGITVPEVLLVPLRVVAPGEAGAVGTLWVVAAEGGHFSQEHARVLTELAAFAAVALRMVQSEERLQAALRDQEQLTQEMTHRVKNLLAVIGGMLRLTARTSNSKEELLTKLSGRLEALSAAHQLVRSSFGDGKISGVTLRQVLATVLRPYEHVLMNGPDVHLGDHATNSMALIFHELATNATKYGALSTERGTVELSWSVKGDELSVVWKETGGPVVSEPASEGFGTSLVRSTVSRHDGRMIWRWFPEGLSISINIPTANLVR
ncbi:GAF domain-containing protein [Bradyrhizobium ontarionense]|uniref:histidine kinase n=1 Tax=Bradyrhizobium ontarionense TaxID=2898149 RepID=A0ABY3R853_9BRAD|nr:HWE histidine kinase domain-containing protein [Bradyrhizobium sp. A19]UFZ03134.1 GAF domain-containing protein [Bradyrhizobium sp. A19]